ncbi:MAG: GNAT family N-acetyltransferase [Bryobacteraceae bacterium]
MLSNPFWLALRTEHQGFAIGESGVLRYPADVIPFAGLENASAEHLVALCRLMAPREELFIVAPDHLPEVDDLVQVGELPGLQLHFERSPPARDIRVIAELGIRRLGPEYAREMLSLTEVAFPGFFRERTYRLGAYFGIFHEDNLVAMAGERIAIPGMREISAVCTHPAHTGKGYATALIHHMLRFHAENGLGRFLHVAAENDRALRLYQHLGFAVTASVCFRHLQRIER